MFRRVGLGAGDQVLATSVAADLLPPFEALWSMHPAAFHRIRMFGRELDSPRWQQAYGHDYRYSGNVNTALPIPAVLEPLSRWAHEQVDPRLNGLLVNWYDGERGHYIGPHRDSPAGRVVGSPIVTVSLGTARRFRLRRHRGSTRHDLEATHGLAIVIPWSTNERWTHEVPHQARDTGRRISITYRAFR